MANVAILVADDFEDVELTKPLDALKSAGHDIEILGIEAGRELTGKHGDATVVADAAVGQRKPNAYDALFIPGGYSPDKLRTDPKMVAFVRDFSQLDRPIAAVCHGPQLLIEAGVVRDREMTSWPSVRTDLSNAGARVVDREVVVDGNFITSRGPKDLDAFSRTLVERLG